VLGPQHPPNPKTAGTDSAKNDVRFTRIKTENSLGQEVNS
jgi:hypothetical protein